MKNHRLWRFTQALNAREKKAFIEFAKSPFHNKNVPLSQLVQLFCEHSTDPITKEEIFTQIFPDANFQLTTWKNLLNKGINLFIDFMANLQLRKKPIQTELLTLQYIARDASTNLREFIPFREKRTLKLLDQEPDGSQKLIYQKQLFELLSGHHNYAGQQAAMVERQLTLSRQHQVRIILDVLRMAVQNKSIQLLQPSAADAFNHKLLIAIEDLPYFKNIVEQDTILQIYYAAYQLSYSATEALYLRLHTLFKTHFASIVASHQMEIVSVMCSYCIGGINRGEAKASKDLHELYTFCADHTQLFQEGFLDERHVHNFILNACRHQAFDKANELLDAYRKLIPSESRKNFYQYHLAYIRFQQSHIQEALALLQDVKFEEDFYYIGHKYLILQCYYLEEAEDLLHYNLESFRVWLTRNQGMAEERRENHLNFIKIFKSYLRLFFSRNLVNNKDYQAKLNQLQVKMQETPRLHKRKWLLSLVDNQL